jgi:cytochrome P450
MTSTALPPGPRSSKWLQLLGMWTRPTATLEGLRRYGTRVTVQLPFQPPFVILSDPAEVKELFAAPAEVVHPGEGAWVLEPIIGRNSVILLDEAAHLTQRRLLLPAFHGERMQRLVGMMTELTEREVAGWPVGEPVALHPRLQRLTLEIILQAVFGLERGPRLDGLRDALTDVLTFSESPLSVLPTMQRALRWTPTMRRFQAAMARTDELVFTLIEERRAQAGADDDPAGDDVLAMLIAARHEDGSPMSRSELRDELMTALVAGHETTASQLSWALDRLAREPAVLARLTDELDRGDGAYLDATITEILRLRPVVPNAEPRLVKQPVRIGGVEYPPGVVLLASAYLIHHDPAIYEEPYAFSPERFLEAAPGSYTWIPFGGGRRRCLGASFALQEMKVVLRTVLGRFAPSATGVPVETTRRRGVTFSPRRGATVILAERSPASPAVASAAHRGSQPAHGLDATGALL